MSFQVSQTTSKPSLLNIPCEIRDVICIEVLHSPTGRVTFVPTSDTSYPFKMLQVNEELTESHGVASLALPQTCKQLRFFPVLKTSHPRPIARCPLPGLEETENSGAVQHLTRVIAVRPHLLKIGVSLPS